MDAITYINNKLPKRINIKDVKPITATKDLKGEEFNLEIRVSFYKDSLGLIPRYWGIEWDEDVFYADEIVVGDWDKDHNHFITELEYWFKNWFSDSLSNKINFWDLDDK